MAAGGCIGSLAIIIPEPELESIINDHLIGKQTKSRLSCTYVLPLKL